MKEYVLESDAEGKKAKVLNSKVEGYRRKEVEKYLGRTGLIVATHESYQEEDMHTVIFKDNKEEMGVSFDAFFDHELKIYYPESTRRYNNKCRKHLEKEDK